MSHLIKMSVEQARERAWRIGQTRDVTVYRLITRGTIEEKVYHRQIYKHFLTNKILKNPQQRRFFKARDMRDLFTFREDNEGCSTETSNIFSQLAGEIDVGLSHEKKQKESSSPLDRRAAKETTSEVGRATSCNKGKVPVDQNSNGINEETDILKSLFDAQGIHVSANVVGTFTDALVLFFFRRNLNTCGISMISL